MSFDFLTCLLFLWAVDLPRVFPAIPRYTILYKRIIVCANPVSGKTIIFALEYHTNKNKHK